MAPPFKIAEFDIMYGEGISHEGDVLDVATGLDIIHKSGSWFSYKDERLGQGRDRVREMLKDNPDLCQEIEQAIRDYYSQKNNPDDIEEQDQSSSEDLDFEMGTFED